MHRKDMKILGLNLLEDAVFLDFDGTLVEIAPRPDAVVVPPDLPDLLHRLHDCASGAVAVVSGRSVTELEQFLHGFPGILVGSHGSERRGAAPLPPPEGLEVLHGEIEHLAAIEGLLPELKPRGAALHFRENPARATAAQAVALALADAFPAFTVQPAKMAFELKPKDASKDRALAELMKEPPFAKRRPVYAGDDSTDESALRWVHDAGGLSVKVGEGESVARHRLESPADVLRWLASAIEGG